MRVHSSTLLMVSLPNATEMPFAAASLEPASAGRTNRVAVAPLVPAAAAVASKGMLPVSPSPVTGLSAAVS
jgi:hypothetical protein